MPHIGTGHEGQSTDELISGHVFVFGLGYLHHREAAPGTLSAGGDVRMAAILSHAPHESARIDVIAGRSGLDAIAKGCNSALTLKQIDGAFSTVPRSILATYVIYVMRALTAYISALNEIRKSKTPVLYSASNLLPDVIACAMLRKSVANSRWVAVVHHLPLSTQVGDHPSVQARVSSGLAVALARIVASTADAIICYNEPVIELVRRFRPDANIIVNGNGIDPDSLMVNRRQGTPLVPSSVVCVGRITPRKGIADLALIWSFVGSQKPAATLSLIGAPAPGGSYDQARTAFQRWGVNDSVRILGVLPRGEVNVHATFARVMVNPSRFEGWSLSIHESLYLGTPVVAWDLPAYRGIYGDCIKTVPEGDHRAFANAVVSLMDDSVEREGYVARGRAFARRHTWESVAQREWQAILSLGGRDD